VGGLPVAPQLVEEAIFDNRSFATRANFEFPQFANRRALDPSSDPPRSMFGPLTAPLLAGGFAMDLAGKVVA
jgi:hypothetical protein